jgi:hypothetical protein
MGAAILRSTLPLKWIDFKLSFLLALWASDVIYVADLESYPLHVTILAPFSPSWVAIPHISCMTYTIVLTVCHTLINVFLWRHAQSYNQSFWYLVVSLIHFWWLWNGRFELKSILSLYNGMAKFIEGSPVRQSDLERCSADRAHAFFLLADHETEVCSCIPVESILLLNYFTDLQFCCGHL